jgi:hypothetical protein
MISWSCQRRGFVDFLLKYMTEMLFFYDDDDDDDYIYIYIFIYLYVSFSFPFSLILYFWRLML